MKFNQLRNSKGWIVLLATLIGLGFGGYTFVNRAVTAQVYVTNCGILDYKPTAILKFCADTSVGIDKIEWATWSAEGATGEGIYQINDCEPTCVAGRLYFADVEIILSKGKRIDDKKALTYISIKTKDGTNLPLSNSHNDEWPMELAG
ncbi:unannotated protein [freshwater metagenome]|nr:hypothetical protein [Actinomycetota bacterium]MSY36919.1 hypothetical protein [Actinomycetota bacterium]MTB04034.1 hypothetical protein [Actinomycetota bacterium]MTB08901.1 hypothetical protein [Actinomycetota bacterium]